VEHLASGGMADVWRAETTGPEGFVKEVALKVVRGEHRGDDAFVRMFVQEARLAARLHHANVVQVFDFAEVDGQHYLAMELVSGRTLREVVDRARERGVRVGLARSVHVAAEVARALAYAHRVEVDGRPAGLVHRDVSPQNVLVSYEGEVKLADFGIARAAGAVEQTRPGTIKGKLAYMAPEQARGEPVDARADVFALGVVLWELCTGRRLFARDSDAATLAALVASDPISRPSAWNEEVPPELDELVLGAVERDPARRIPTADALAEALAGLRLRLARGPEDVDLRALMSRLWPEGEGRRAAEATAVRPAEEPLRTVAFATAPAVEAAADADPTELGDAPTRAAAAPPRSFIALAVLAAVAVGAGIVGLGKLVGRRWEPTPTAAPAPVPVPASTPASTPEPFAPSAGPQRGPESRGESATTSPPAPARPATLTVNAAPWATVYVDGERVGDTPVELQLPPGHHRVRAVHPRSGEDGVELDLAPGERRAWRPALRVAR
jgi:serine/threonine-protein kinase